jgi:thioesterase domain-containing protein
MFAVTLAEYVDAEMPVYGLQPSTLSGRLIGELDPESLARQYVAAIRAVQPEGPYFLFGYSLGGLIAFAMACQLEDAGQKVALLGIGDMAAPGSSPETDASRAKRAPLTPRNLPVRAIRSARARVRRRRREISRRAARWRMGRCMATGRAVPPHLRKDFSMWQLGEHHRTYRPLRGISSPTLLVQTDSAGRVTPEAWGRFVSGPIETVLIPGRHVDLIHRPMIEELGAALNAKISPLLVDA